MDPPKAEEHARPTFLSDFILGSQDGLVNILGIVLGLTAATHDLRLLLIAALAALAAESISMSAVAFTSTRARRNLYLSEMAREQREMRELPLVEREEVRTVFREWGYTGPHLEEMTEAICANPRAMLEFMMAFELKLSPIEATAARNSAILVGFATIVGSFIPLLPFFFLGSNILQAVELSVAFSAATLFVIGYYEAKLTVGSIWKSGLQMAAIGLAAGFAGFLVGHFLGAP
jgi:VIT1/CCC1 family predicted Fe2+/Mn2+ transporter